MKSDDTIKRYIKVLLYTSTRWSENFSDEIARLKCYAILDTGKLSGGSRRNSILYLAFRFAVSWLASPGGLGPLDFGIESRFKVETIMSLSDNARGNNPTGKQEVESRWRSFGNCCFPKRCWQLIKLLFLLVYIVKECCCWRGRGVPPVWIQLRLLRDCVSFWFGGSFGVFLLSRIFSCS